MDNEFQDLEDTLKKLQPAVPDDVCMERMLAAIEGRLPEMSVATKSVERELSALNPAPLTLASERPLLDVLSRVPFPKDKNVVLFPGANKTAEKSNERRPWFAAAAAVAVAGVFSAMMLDGPKTHPVGPVADQDHEVGQAPASVTKGIVNASVGSGLREAEDQGVSWTADGRPMRRVRVIYTDKVGYYDSEGRLVELERPRVEYLLVPENID